MNKHSVTAPNITYQECSITVGPGDQIINGTDIQLDNNNDDHWFYTVEGRPYHRVGKCEKN